MTFLRQFSWVPTGLAVAAIVAAMFGTQRAWILMMVYALFNLFGTAHVLGIITAGHEGGTRSQATYEFVEQRGPVILKACFVAQLPTGLVLFMLDGV